MSGYYLGTMNDGSSGISFAEILVYQGNDINGAVLASAAPL